MNFTLKSMRALILSAALLAGGAPMQAQAPDNDGQTAEGKEEREVHHQCR